MTEEVDPLLEPLQGIAEGIGSIASCDQEPDVAALIDQLPRGFQGDTESLALEVVADEEEDRRRSADPELLPDFLAISRDGRGSVLRVLASLPRPFFLEHWDFLEAIYHQDPATGKVLYSSFRGLYLANSSSLGELELLESLVLRMAGLPEARRVLAPLGVGGHVDHWLVQRAASKRFGNQIDWYEEFPYSQKTPWEVWRATRPRRHWRSQTLTLAPEDLAKRCQAIACYASQLEMLFGSRQRLERRVRSSVQRMAGERTWRRVGS